MPSCSKSIHRVRAKPDWEPECSLQKGVLSLMPAQNEMWGKECVAS